MWSMKVLIFEYLFLLFDSRVLIFDSGVNIFESFHKLTTFFMLELLHEIAFARAFAFI